MKSIIEEGSSVFKALENAWIKADKPKDFSVKVYEEAERNFIGIVTKSAKIGIFFDEPRQIKQEIPIAKPHVQQMNAQDHQPKNQAQAAPKKKVTQQEIKPKNQEVAKTLDQPTKAQPAKKPRNAPIFNLDPKNSESKNLDSKFLDPKDEDSVSVAPEAKLLPPVWTDNMLENIQKWVEETLQTIDKKINFKITTQNFYLKITFDSSFYEDKNREKQLFSSLSTLILQMLKHKYRRPLKGYKIILSCDQI